MFMRGLRQSSRYFLSLLLIQTHSGPWCLCVRLSRAKVLEFAIEESTAKCFHSQAVGSYFVEDIRPVSTAKKAMPPPKRPRAKAPHLGGAFGKHNPRSPASSRAFGHAMYRHCEESTVKLLES